MSFDICFYCSADGCLDGTVQHAADCPRSTNIYPITDYERSDLCCACCEPLADEEFYTLVPEGRDGWSFIVCMSCAALGREVKR